MLSGLEETSGYPCEMCDELVDDSYVCDICGYCDACCNCAKCENCGGFDFYTTVYGNRMISVSLDNDYVDLGDWSEEDEIDSWCCFECGRPVRNYELINRLNDACHDYR